MRRFPVILVENLNIQYNIASSYRTTDDAMIITKIMVNRKCHYSKKNPNENWKLHTIIGNVRTWSYLLNSLAK